MQGSFKMGDEMGDEWNFASGVLLLGGGFGREGGGGVDSTQPTYFG